MSQRNGYRVFQYAAVSISRRPDETFTVPDRGYFALGDNSYFSRDSRDFGAVRTRMSPAADFSSTGPLANVGDLFASCQDGPLLARRAA